MLIIISVLLGIGLLFQFNPVSWLYQYFEDMLMRFPLIKTLYGAVKISPKCSTPKGSKNTLWCCWILQASGKWSALLPPLSCPNRQRQPKQRGRAGRRVFTHELYGRRLYAFYSALALNAC